MCSALPFNIAECADKDTSIDALSASLSLHDIVYLLYHNIISHSHIVLFVRFHILNWYSQNSAWYLCTAWGTLASDSDILFSPLYLDITVNSDPQKHFLNFHKAQLTAAGSTTKICPDFPSGDIIDPEMKEIGRRFIPSRD